MRHRCAAMSAAKERLLELYRGAVADGSLVKLTLAAPVADAADLRQLLLRPVRLRGGLHLSCVRRYTTRDVTKNLAPAEAEDLVARALGSEFRTAHLFTTTVSAQFAARAGKAARLRLGPAQHAAPPSLAHDRGKRRALPAE